MAMEQHKARLWSSSQLPIGGSSVCCQDLLDLLAQSGIVLGPAWKHCTAGGAH